MNKFLPLRTVCVPFHRIGMTGMLALALLLLCATGRAEEHPYYQRVDFQVEATRQVQNDLLTVQMSIDLEDRQPTLVAQRLNHTLNDALAATKKYPAVKTTSGNQQTYPNYTANQRINGWHGRGELRLESRDFKAIGELIAELQPLLQLNHIQFTIAHDTRAKVENELIDEAIHAFQSRADTIRQAMGSSTYKTVHMSIQPSGSTQPYPMMSMARGMATEQAAPSPEFSGGDSRLSIVINGTIEAQ